MPERGDPIYREYLEREASDSGGFADGLKTIGWRFGRFALLKYGTQTLLQPVESIVTLRQVQYQPIGSHPSNRADLPAEDAGYLKDDHDPPRKLELLGNANLWTAAGEISSKFGWSRLWQGMHASWSYKTLQDIGDSIGEQLSHEVPLFLEKPRAFPASNSTTDQGTMLGERAREIPYTTSLGEYRLFGTRLGAHMLLCGAVGVLLSPFEASRVQAIVGCRARKSHQQGYSMKRLASLQPVFQFASHAIVPLLRESSLRVTSWLVSSVYSRWSFTNLATGELEVSALIAAVIFGVQGIIQCAPLLVTLPLNIIRQRLLVLEGYQNHYFEAFKTPSPVKQYDPSNAGRGGQEESGFECGDESARAHRSRAVVPLPPRSYRDATDCAWRMIREEGFSSLYRGLGLSVVASLGLYLAALITHLGESFDFVDEDGF